MMKSTQKKPYQYYFKKNKEGQGSLGNGPLTNSRTSSNTNKAGYVRYTMFKRNSLPLQSEKKVFHDEAASQQNKNHQKKNLFSSTHGPSPFNPTQIHQELYLEEQQKNKAKQSSSLQKLSTPPLSSARRIQNTGFLRQQNKIHQFNVQRVEESQGAASQRPASNLFFSNRRDPLLQTRDAIQKECEKNDRLFQKQIEMFKESFRNDSTTHCDEVTITMKHQQSTQQTIQVDNKVENARTTGAFFTSHQTLPYGHFRNHQNLNQSFGGQKSLQSTKKFQGYPQNPFSQSVVSEFTDGGHSTFSKTDQKCKQCQKLQDQLQRESSVNSDLENKKKNNIDQIYRQQNTIKELQQKESALKAQLSAETQEVSRLTTLINYKQKKLVQLQQQLAKTKLQFWENLQKQMEKEKSSYEGKIEQLQQKNTSYLNQIANMQKKVEQLQSQHRQIMKNTILSHELKIRQIEQQNTKAIRLLGKDHQSQRTKLIAYYKDAQNLFIEKQQKRLESEYRQKLQKLKTQLKVNDNNDNTMKIKIMKEEHQSLVKSMSIKHQQTIESLINRNNKQVTELKSKVQSLQNQVDSQIPSLQKTIESFTTEVKGTQSILGKLNLEKTQLTQQRNELAVRQLKLKEEISKLVNENKKFVAGSHESRQSINSINEVNSLSSAQQEHIRRIQSLKIQNKNLQKALVQRNSTIQKYKHQLEQKTLFQQARTTTSATSIQNAVGNQQQQQDWQNNYKTLLRDVAALNTLIDRKQNDKIVLEEELAGYKKMVPQWQKEKFQLKQLISQAQIESEGLKKQLQVIKGENSAILSEMMDLKLSSNANSKSNSPKQKTITIKVNESDIINLNPNQNFDNSPRDEEIALQLTSRHGSQDRSDQGKNSPSEYFAEQLQYKDSLIRELQQQLFESISLSKSLKEQLEKVAKKEVYCQKVSLSPSRKAVHQQQTHSQNAVKEVQKISIGSGKYNQTQSPSETAKCEYFYKVEQFYNQVLQIFGLDLISSQMLEDQQQEQLIALSKGRKPSSLIVDIENLSDTERSNGSEDLEQSKTNQQNQEEGKVKERKKSQQRKSVTSRQGQRSNKLIGSIGFRDNVIETSGLSPRQIKSGMLSERSRKSKASDTLSKRKNSRKLNFSAQKHIQNQATDKDNDQQLNEPSSQNGNAGSNTQGQDGSSSSHTRNLDNNCSDQYERLNYVMQFLNQNQQQILKTINQWIRKLQKQSNTINQYKENAHVYRTRIRSLSQQIQILQGEKLQIHQKYEPFVTKLETSLQSYEMRMNELAHKLMESQHYIMQLEQALNQANYECLKLGLFATNISKREKTSDLCKMFVSMNNSDATTTDGTEDIDQKINKKEGGGKGLSHPCSPRKSYLQRFYHTHRKYDEYLNSQRYKTDQANQNARKSSMSKAQALTESLRISDTQKMSQDDIKGVLNSDELIESQEQDGEVEQEETNKEGISDTEEKTITGGQNTITLS